ncbi:F-box/FBD/LRR-repeat protein At3g14710-like [Vicia villosa]|uniref:F-box/FBD/LRR-repeat protein At3g14710-like n=1 Tax=Vicia villosa TaxID=3911 RepID=UPI00273C768B|nr:F-box/FBD/LRR-repeat protein At3g14710-like [Vicia villosa]XP_058736042.1 F-box/FBD/LRR-repeat protein At3g14710-like [Vicia villosa]
MESVGSSTHKKHKAKDDIISDLPESLITHILSFLPTKDAVRTSVLSKRWIEKWTFITKVELNDSVFYSSKRKKSERKTLKQCFINFVNRVLLLTGSHSVESFSLVITNKYDPTVLNTLITFILKKRIKRLSISSREELTFSTLTSHYLFNHATCLEVLVLMTHYSSPIKIPIYKIYGVFLFTSLKLLKLYGVTFTIDKSQQIIFSVLKKFETHNCSWLSAGEADVTLELKAPLLESVSILQDYMPPTREPLCKIKISDSCLKEFTYRGDGMSQAIVLSDQPPACHATFTITLCRVQETESRVSPILKQFSQVKRIKLEFRTQPNVAILPKFAMLSYLELGYVSVQVLLGLIQNSPTLNTLLFKGILTSNHELPNSAAVPDCLTSSLQVVKFGDVWGNEHELLLAKYLMENGTVLERMSFSFTDECLDEPKVIEEFKEKLYSFKKGISFAILEFSYDCY